MGSKLRSAVVVAGLLMLLTGCASVDTVMGRPVVAKPAAIARDTVRSDSIAEFAPTDTLHVDRIHAGRASWVPAAMLVAIPVAKGLIGVIYCHFVGCD